MIDSPAPVPRPRVIFVNEEQSVNEVMSIFVVVRMLGLTVTKFNDKHCANAFTPILVVLSGIIIDVNKEPANASSPMISTILPASKVTDSTPRPGSVVRNAPAPMFFMVDGITMFFIKVSWNARAPMLVTPAGIIILVNDEPWNASSSMVVTLFPAKVTDSIPPSALVLRNAPAPMRVTPTGITICVIKVSWNALAPILVTVSGMIILVKSSPRNAPSPIVVTLRGIVTSTNEVPWKALGPIYVTDTGMSMVVRLLEFWNALSPMLVMVLTSSNITDFIPLSWNALTPMLVIFVSTVIFVIKFVMVNKWSI